MCAKLRETIIGDKISDKDGAKKSAALKACIRLHQLAELDDNLEVKKDEAVLEGKEYLFPLMENETSNGLIGTKSKKRRHELIVS